MQVSLARTKSSRAGLTMFVAAGCATCSLPGSVALLAADVPFGDGLGLDVVVHRMAAVAERAGRPLAVVGGIVRHPPVGVRLRRSTAARLRCVTSHCAGSGK